MPPKKKDTTDTDAGSGETTWKWTPENDRTLFLLILGRDNLGRSDWEKIATALSPNVNWNGVRQRISKFRGEQKKKFDELGWDDIETSAKAPAKGAVKGSATPRKRKGSEEGEDTPSRVKTARARKEAKSEETVVEDKEEEEGDIGVKEEVEDEV